MGRHIHGKTWVRLAKESALLSQNGRCLYCRCPLTLGKATADHLWPKSKRGGDKADNIGAACRECNLAKADMTHVQFFKLIRKQAPPKNVRWAILMVWASRRIWRRTNRACENIQQKTA